MSEIPSSPSASEANLSETGEHTEIVSAEALEALKALQAADGMLSQLRAEVGATTDKSRQARLHAEIGELEERAGDEPGAARDYLAAFNADPTFREPLEGLVRLLERRRSLKNLGRLLEALVRAAVTPDEKSRALTMHAAFLEDVSEDLDGSKAALRDATALEASEIEAKNAWLALELVAGKTHDATLRAEALSERAHANGDPTWQALLLIDLARLSAAEGDLGKAFELLDEAKRKGGGATYLAVHAARELSAKDTDDESRKKQLLSALEADAEMIALAMSDAARGDALGVPHERRSTGALIDALIRVSNLHRAAGDMNAAGQALERAQEATQAEGTLPLVRALVLQARMRVAEILGDTARASQLAEMLLATEKDGGVAASLAMRVAEQAANEGDVAGALAALSSAVEKDSACLPARALQLDLLADGGDPALFATQLEAFATTLPTDEARGRAALLSAFVRAQANDTAASKSALNEAKSRGVEPELLWRVGRMLARLLDDANWYEETTRRLIQALTTKDDRPGRADHVSDRPNDGELARLWFEIVRAKLLRGDIEGAQVALAELADVQNGAWLGNALEAFLPDFVGAAPAEDGGSSANSGGGAGEGASPFEKLADLETDPATARGLALVAAIDAQRRGATDRARTRLRALADQDPADPVVAVYLADLARTSGDAAGAAGVLSTCAEATTDEALAGALHMEAALSFWSSGDRRAALAAFEHAAAKDGATAKMAHAWSARGVDIETIDSRRRALDAATGAGEETARIAIERFAAEIGSDSARAHSALISAEDNANGDLQIAASLARLIWPGGDPERDDAASGKTWPASDDDEDRVSLALAHLAAAGVDANRLAAAEQLRRARHQAPESAVQAAQGWFDAGGGVVAALEWIAAAVKAKAVEDEAQARRELATCFDGFAAEAISASAAVLLSARSAGVAPELVAGKSEAVRLANLELAPPGSDPRKRANVLRSLGGALGEEAELDALTLAAWSMLTAGEAQTAKDLFTRTSTVRPNDISLWEGLRAASEKLGDSESRARAATELGARCKSPERGAAFWEEAATLYVELGQDAAAEAAYDKSFARDATRAVAFDKLFRRVRDKKDGERLLAMITRRLDVADDPTEIAKLFWEQARVLRERGDSDGALRALENVTMIEPEHVGALALTGEILIRRGQFEEAAANLAKLATLSDAPAKNRVTAGIAAVDLYENKLDRFDKALEVLLSLHRAELSTLPVRERLARAAARTGSWIEATAILEQLMEERPEAQGRIEAARLAMAIHRDRLNNPSNAALAVVRLIEESPADGEGIDILLELKGVDDKTKRRLFVKSEDALLAAIQKTPDAAQVRRLARVVRITGNEELEHIALSLGSALGMNDVAGDALLAQYTARKPRMPQIAFTPATLGKLMSPGDDAPMASLFALLGPTLTEALGPALPALGVTRKEKVDAKSGLQVRNEIGAWTGAFGIPEFELYVGGRDPNGVQGVPGEPASLVVGANINAPLSPASRARVARELCGIVRGTTVLRSRDDTTIAAIVVAACKLAEVPIQSPTYAVQAEIDKLVSKAISRRTKKLLPDICRAVVGSGQDARTWSKNATMSLARAALVASGDAPSAFADLLGDTVENLRETLRDRLKTDERAANLVRFALSPAYLELRRALGLEGLS